MSSLPRLALLLGLIGALGADAFAQDRRREELPGYYQFYKRVGDQAELDAEREFAAARARGDYAIERPDTELESITLPRADGRKVNLRRNYGKRNTLLVTFRSWW